MYLYVKKIVSLNPDLFEFIRQDEAKDKYLEYTKSIHKKLGLKGLPYICPYTLEPDNNHIKSFDQWLNTEI